MGPKYDKIIKIQRHRSQGGEGVYRKTGKRGWCAITGVVGSGGGDPWSWWGGVRVDPVGCACVYDGYDDPYGVTAV